MIAGQTFRLSLNTGRSLSGGSSPTVLYKKPDGTTGSWTGVISGQNIVYSVGSTDMTMVGVWEVQAVVTISGNIKKGKVAKLTIDKSL